MNPGIFKNVIDKMCLPIIFNTSRNSCHSLHKIYFPVRLGGLKGANTLGENTDISNFYENKNINTRR